MSRSKGTGCPQYFYCPTWRRAAVDAAARGPPHQIETTGRTRGPYPTRNTRQSFIAREYRCLTCGHVGWSRHIDLE